MVLPAPSAVSIRIYDRAGVLAVRQEEDRPAGTQAFALDLARFSPGVYYWLISLRDASGTVTLGPGKFVVLR